MKTVIGLFDNFAQAQNAARDLEAAGIPREDISVIANNAGGQYDQYTNTATTTTTAPAGTPQEAGSETAKGAVAGGVTGLIIGLAPFVIPGLGAIAAAGWLTMTLIGAGVGAAVGLVGALTGIGVPHEEAHYYQEAVRRGGVLLAVRAQDDMANQVAQILGDDGAVNIDERAEQFRREGFVPGAATTAATTTTATQTTPPAPTVTAQPPVKPVTPVATTATSTNQMAQPTLANQGEVAIPVVEEELQVGKREVERGGVRIFSHVTEQPVQEQVTLHEEHVNVQRRPVDRPVSQADLAAMQDRSFEVTERTEEPVVQKQARVVEEVVVNKEATERTQTVQDTIRRTDVEVQPIQGGEHVSRGGATFDTWDTEWRSDWRSHYANQGGNYEQYEPAYRYGYDMAANPTYQGREWTTVEPQLQRDWEMRQPGTWNQFKNSVRYAWDKATGSQRGGIKTGGYHTDDGTPDQRGMMEKVADTITGDRIDDKTGKPV